MTENKPIGKRITSAVICVIFLPIIILFLLVCGVVYLGSSPFERRRYKESEYYKKFGYPYSFGITNRNGYTVINALAEGRLDAELISTGTAEPEFLKFNNTLYILDDIFTFAADHIYDELYVVEEDDKKRLFDEAFAEEVAKEIYEPYREYEIKYLIAENHLLFYKENDDADKEEHIKGLMRSHNKIAFCRDFSTESLKEII